MKTSNSAVLRSTVALLAVLALPLAAPAQNENGNFPVAPVPTLDGAGLAALAGALSIGGAWILSRNRNKRK